MAYFAVVRDRDNKRFSVTTCHLNLWVLPGFLKRYFQFDIGVRVKAEEDGLTGFLLALPFIVGEGGVEDLHDLLLRNDTAPLVFGEPVLVQGTKISYGDTKNLEIGHIHAQKSREVPEWTSKAKHCSVWKIELSSSLMHDDEQYVRLRFPVGKLGRRWVKKRSLLAENGAIMDFRVADIREAQEAMDWASLQDKIVPIGTLNAFVITPVSLQARSASPELRYTRLLEGNAWEPYIRRRTGLFRSQHLLIFYWKATDVSITKPFRGFLNLSREFGVSSLANHVRTGIIVLIAFVVVINARDIFAAAGSPQIGPLLVKVGYPAGGVTAISALVWALRHRGPAGKIYSAFRWLIITADKSLYRRTP